MTTTRTHISRYCIAAAQFLYHHVPTIASIHPKGGERSGGTNVTVSGTGFRELDRGQGLQCHFVDESMTPFSSYVSGKSTTGIPASITVPAYLPTGGASTSAFDASETIYCVYPRQSAASMMHRLAVVSGYLSLAQGRSCGLFI